MQAGKSQRSVLALVITCALILGFGIPLIPLVGVDSAEGTEVSAASDVATVSAENSLQNGSFEQPDVYQYRETSDVPYWKSTTTSGNIEIGSVFKNGNGDNDSLHMRTGEKVAAAEGSQFGKPATSNGNYSIYQRLATTQGAKYRWSLKHRARPSGSKSGFDTLAVITADTHGAEPPSFSWGGGTDLFHNMFEWMFGNGWDSPGWTFPDSGEGTFKLCSATLGNGTVNGYQSHWYRAGNDCSDTEHFPITWTITFVSSVFNQYTRNGWNEYERHLHAVRREHATAAGARPSRAIQRGATPNTRLRIPRSRHSPSTVSSQPTARSPSCLPASPCSAATQRPAPRITPPIGRIASPSQSANKRRLASLTGSVIALPYFVPRKSVPGNKMRKGNDRRYPLLFTTYDFAYLWRDVRQKRRKNRRFIPPTMLCGTLFRSRLCQTGLNRKS